MRILVAGASGFLGSHLVDELTSREHQVTRLVRREPSGPDEARWTPDEGQVDQSLVDDADVVVNLAGSPTAGNPHSSRWAEELEQSRVSTTRLLAERVAASSTSPAFVAGNAVGWYGDHGDQEVTEATDTRGDAFMTRVCRAWQDAAGPAVENGGRVVFLRTAPVLHRTSPPLKQLLLPFKLGLGTRLGSGDQYFPIVSLRDWVAGTVAAIEDDALSGPVNLSTAQTPTNAEFTDALARAVGRKAFLAVPSPALKVGAGRLAPELLGSVRVAPAALTGAGHPPRDEDVVAVLRTALATQP